MQNMSWSLRVEKESVGERRGWKGGQPRPT